MEDSIECEIKDSIKDNFLYNMDISSSDPIPSLLLPIKKTKKPLSLISNIISISQKNNNNNFSQIQFKINKFITNANLQKHNSTPQTKNVMLVDDLIESKETHFIAVFKDFLISDYQEEFLRRYFKFDEIVEVLPKFYQYYKNYLTFFCKGTFSDFNVNEIMQEYGECQAEFYYNRNYGHKDREKEREKEKKEKKDNNNGMNNDNMDNNDMENVTNMDVLKLIFTPSIEYSIEKVKKSKYDLYNKSGNRQELSNIKPYTDSKENTIALPENSTVSNNDAITKENSIRYIINLMNKKKQRISLNKKIKNTKKELINKNNKCYDNDNKNINMNLNNNKNNSIKNETQKLSKTTSNLNVKNYKNNKNNKSRNKSNSLKQNHFTGNNNYKNKNIPSISNYKKYIDILSYKQKNNSNKSNEPKIKICQEEFSFSPNNTKNLKHKNKVSTINTNNIFGHFNLFSSNNFNNNFGIKNKINSSLFLLNHLDKNYKNLNNYNTLFPLSISKNNIGKKKYNNNRLSDKKLKKKSKVKESNNITNTNKYLYFNPNIKSYIKTFKNVSCPKNTNNNNNNNNTSNKSLSYSTVNNCNININNNIILSNNYYHNKHQQGNSTNKNIQQKKNIMNNASSNNNYFKTFTSRNNQNDINRFKTDVNILNSILNQDNGKNKVNIIKNTINNPFKTFRKSSNNDILMKPKYFDVGKKSINNNNYHHQRNLSLKNIPITAGSYLYNKSNYSGNKATKLSDEPEFSSTSKTYKNLGLKKSGNNNNHQKKIIFDYKRK